MSSYKSGQVSALLFSNGTQKGGLSSLFNKINVAKGQKGHSVQAISDSKLKVKAKTKKKADNLKPNREVGDGDVLNDVHSKKKDKKEIKQPNLDALNGAAKKEAPAWKAPFLHESLVKNNSQKSPADSGRKRKIEKPVHKDDEETVGKRPRRDRVRDKNSDSRTIFVGNCPLSADKKVLKSLFKDYGQIETIRFRCAPPADPNLPRRAIVITKNFHDKCKSYVAYIVFKEEASAKKALALNGHLLDGLHLRVDISAMSKKHDKKRSIFVGNLPFDVTEEDLWTHFEDCGDITNVRIVRDRQTSLGKGIGFVQFESKDSVSLAIKLNKTKVQGREIRVMVCTNKDKDQTTTKKDKKQSKSDGDGKSSQSKMKPKKPLFGPSNSTSVSFQAKLKIKKDKRLRKMKKKKENAKKDENSASSVVKLPKRKSSSLKLPNSKKNKKKVKGSSRAKSKKDLGKKKGLKGKEKKFKGKS